MLEMSALYHPYATIVKIVVDFAHLYAYHPWKDAVMIAPSSIEHPHRSRNRDQLALELEQRSKQFPHVQIKFLV